MLARISPALLAAVVALMPTPARGEREVKLVLVEASHVVLPAPFEKVDLLEEARQALGARGCQVVASCHGGDCAAQAGSLHATEVMTMTAEYRVQQLGCEVVVAVRGVGADRAKQTSRFSGATCPAARLVEQTKDLVGKACEQLQAEEPAPAAIEPPSSGPNPAPSSMSGDIARKDMRLSKPGLALAGGGVLVAAFGGVAWYLDGRPAHPKRPGETMSRDLYDTKSFAIPVTLVGLAAMGVGGWMIWHERTALAVIPGPGAIAVAGRF
jgi:hypothetical protein